MPKPSKRFRANAEHIDATKRYAITEAFTTLKKFKVAKFDESVDVAIKLGVDPRQSDQMVRGGR